MEPVDPLTLLTRDGWDHVLVRLNNPTDRLNAANSNLLFRYIMKFDQQENWTCMMFDMTLSYLFKHLETFDLFQLRLANRSFKTSVDNFLRNGETFWREDPCWDKRPKLVLENYLNPQKKGYEIDQLFLEIGTLPLAKILGGALQLHFEGNLADCRPFLREFGNHVIHLSLCVKPHKTLLQSPIELMEFLLDILVTCVNLVTLKLDVSGFEDHGPGEDDWRNAYWICIVERFWARNPPPELPNLKYLSLNLPDMVYDRVGSYAVFIFQALITKYAPQICTLSVCQGKHLSAPMPLLENLQVVMVIENDLGQLDDLEAPKLQRVHLTVHNRDMSPWSLFWCLKKYGGTLTHLSIRNYGNFDRMEITKIDQFQKMVKLPRLKELKLIRTYVRLGITRGKTFTF